MSTNISPSGYQNVNEHLTILLSKCQRISHYPFIKMSTNISLSGYQKVHEHITITMTLFWPTSWDLINISFMNILTDCQWTSHYSVIKMPTSISLFVYQNVDGHLTIRLSKCPRTSHYPFIKMSMNIHYNW
jgi:hypothetical protein